MAVKQQRFNRALKYYFHRLFPRHERSAAVAISVFLGVFIGVMPTLGVALVLTAIAAELARVPKGPGLVASFIAIPPTLFLFFYPLGYFGVGLPLVQPESTGIDFLGEIKRLNLMNLSDVAGALWIDARGHIVAFLVGMTLVAAATGLVCAGTTYFMMERRRRVREERRRIRRAQGLPSLPPSEPPPRPTKPPARPVTRV